jgi:hypothetical protein
MLLLVACAWAASPDLTKILGELHLPETILQSTEINESMIRKAHEAMKAPRDPNSHVIISMRWNSLEEQLAHFIFGAGLAYALNRSIVVEMRHYPLTKEQPPIYLKFRDLNPELTDPPVFQRVRISREFYCKGESDFRTDSPSIPLLVRNFDDVTGLYGNHFIAQKLKERFGYHAGFFIAYRHLDLSGEKGWEKTIGVDARSFANVRRMKHLKEGKLIAGNFTRALANFKFNKGKVGYDVMTNDSVVEGAIRQKYKNVRVLSHSWKSFVDLVHCDVFVGTYRSKLSTAVNMLRAARGYLLNTDTGD